jgi:hypothetical protein
MRPACLKSHTPLPFNPNPLPTILLGRTMATAKGPAMPKGFTTAGTNGGGVGGGQSAVGAGGTSSKAALPDDMLGQWLIYEMNRQLQS